MYDIEGHRAMDGAEGANRPEQRATPSDVVNARSGQIPLGGLRFLIQGEYLQIIMSRKPADQSQERRNHSILSRSVDASRHHQRNAHSIGSHGLSSSTAKQRSQGLDRLERMPASAQLEPTQVGKAFRECRPPGLVRGVGLGVRQFRQ